MKKKDLEQLAEIALRANAGDEAQAGKMAKRLWRVRRWAAEQTWRAGTARERRDILERIVASLDGALRELGQLKAHDNSPAREAASAAREPAPSALTTAAEQKAGAPKPAEEDGPLVPKSTEEKVDLVIAANKSGAKA